MGLFSYKLLYLVKIKVKARSGTNAPRVTINNHVMTEIIKAYRFS